MKLFHLSDLHLGKRVNGFSMVDDQVHIMGQILDIIRKERPHGVLIAGDVYDRSVPSTEAVALLDTFLVALSQEKIPVFIISGNHDSAERLAFGGRLMEAHQMYLSPVYDGTLTPHALEDAHGVVDIYLLPFAKPVQVRHLFPENTIESYSDAVACSLAQVNLDKSHRNVLLAHHFVTGAQRCESEELSVGGTDNVDASVFHEFDYVALGHLHGPQSVGRETIRYSGSPLKYSFSEAGHTKSITVVELHENGVVNISTIALNPIRDMVELRGTYMELTKKSFYDDMDCQAYVRVTLTDEEDVPDAVGRLRTIYPNLMRLDYDNRRTRSGRAMPELEDGASLSPLDFFAQLYQQQNDQPLSQEQTAYLTTLVERVWGEEV